jgi:cytochrome c oxidase subunit 2
MSRSKTFAAILAAAVLCPSLLHSQEPRKIAVVAKKYEFRPSRIELKAGEPVEITFQSEDTKHGFVCKELNVAKIEFTKDSPGKVTFTPEKAGTYKFKCAHFCGLGHPKMKGEFVVTP